MKKLLSILSVIVILIAGGIGGEVGKQIGNKIVKKEKVSSQELEKKLIEGFEDAVREVNRSTPMMVDKETRLDKATVEPGARVVYHYTFPNYTSQDIDSNWLLENLGSTVKNQVCNNKDMKLSLQYGSVYVYSYSGNDGISIARFEISRDDCGFSKKTP